jgi:DNA-binding response OmpR family regulator
VNVPGEASEQLLAGSLVTGFSHARLEMVTRRRKSVGMRPKVLSVDDDPEFAELIRYNLELQGCEVVLASNGVQALHLARSQLPDVILLDLMLPDLDGFSVCQILRAQPSTRDIPVFIVSALDEPWAGKRGSKARFSKYFKKPVDLKVLGESVRTAWEEHNALLRAALSDVKNG